MLSKCARTHIHQSIQDRRFSLALGHNSRILRENALLMEIAVTVPRSWPTARPLDATSARSPAPRRATSNSLILRPQLGKLRCGLCRGPWIEVRAEGQPNHVKAKRDTSFARKDTNARLARHTKCYYKNGGQAAPLNCISSLLTISLPPFYQLTHSSRP